MERQLRGWLKLNNRYEHTSRNVSHKMTILVASNLVITIKDLASFNCIGTYLNIPPIIIPRPHKMLVHCLQKDHSCNRDDALTSASISIPSSVTRNVHN